MKRLDDILHSTSLAFNVPAGDIKSRMQVRYIAEARHAFCYAAQRQGWIANHIAFYLQRDRTTVRQSIQRAVDLVGIDADYRTKFNSIK